MNLCLINDVSIWEVVLGETATVRRWGWVIVMSSFLAEITLFHTKTARNTSGIHVLPVYMSGHSHNIVCSSVSHPQPLVLVGTSQIKLQILKLETVQIWCLWVDLCPVKSIISFWSISFKNWRHLYLLSHFRIERLIRRLRENPDQNKATEFKSKAWREASLWEVMLLGVPFQTRLKQTNKQTKYPALTNILFNKVFPH